MLQLHNIHCARNECTLFSELSVTFRTGTLWHITGKNGSGKTTLLRILAGIHTHFTGTLHYDPPYTFSDLLLIGHQLGIKKELTPLENIHWWRSMHKHDRGTSPTQAIHIVELTQYNRPCSFLSRGQNQRAALARLWLSTAPLWLLDEPFTALDRSFAHQVAAQLVAHCHNGGTVLLTAHYMPPLLDQYLHSLNVTDFSGTSMTLPMQEKK